MVVLISLLISLTVNSVYGCDSYDADSALSISSDIGSCLSINRNINANDLLELAAADFSLCSGDGQRDDCERSIHDFISAHPESFIATVATNVLNTPSTSCPCLESSYESLNHCFPAVDELVTLCQWDSSASEIDTAPLFSSNTDDECSQAMFTTCHLSNPTFEDAVSCIENHMSELSGACSVAMNSMLANMFDECQYDVSSLCNDETSYVLSCLQDNYNELSSECREKVDSYLEEDYPCTKESSMLCPEATLPHDVLDCLREKAETDSEAFSEECLVIVEGYSACTEHPPGGQEGHPKPKASPANTQKAENRRLQGGKPKPKPKPKPGPGEKPCWYSNGEGIEGDEIPMMEASDLHSENQHTPAPSAALISISVVLVVAVVGMVMFAYQRSANDGGSLPTVKGYWRAPSIQAMIYDDSTHSTTELVSCESEFEMKKSQSPTVTASVVVAGETTSI